VLNGIFSVTLTGLTPDSVYYGKRRCGSEVDVFTMMTLSSGSGPVSVQLSAPGGASTCVVEYGPTAALGSLTAGVPVSGGRCSVSVPPGAAYWRHGYLSGSGTVVARGNIQRRGL
jgi:hypothetical protein